MTRLVVIGDALLDRDVIGDSSRLTPDAPVPVVDVGEVLDRPGGAGLAAAIAADPRLQRSMGTPIEVSLVCALGDDHAGRTLGRLLEDRGVEVLDLGGDGTTPEKVRVRVAGQSLVRLDRGGGVAVAPPCAAVADLLAGADAVLVADYGRGVAAHPDLRALLSPHRRRGRPLVWDPHPSGPEPVHGTTLATPNHLEARGRCPAEQGDGLPGDARRAHRLRARWASAGVAVTRGADGVVAVTGDGAPLVVTPDHPLGAVDTCGAGDAFAVGAALALGSGNLWSDALHMAVTTAGRYLAAGAAGALATGTTSGWTPSSVAETVRPAPTVVATGGCFDVLHPGHLALLGRARSLGDRLVVLVNSDRSVRRLKGPDRPVHCEADRVATLRALRDVDDVIVFDEDTPATALQQLRPALFVKGGDYTSTELPEAAVLAEWGGAAVTVPFLPGHSTTAILGRMDGDEVARAR